MSTLLPQKVAILIEEYEYKILIRKSQDRTLPETQQTQVPASAGG